MTISMISNVMNIAGNAIMIWVFHMGVAGAALSTLISRIFCAVVVLIQLRKEREGQEIVVRDYFKIRPNWSMIKRILGIGIPSGVENSMFQLGKLAIQSTVSTLGTAAIAAQAMTNILENLNGIAAIGVGVGLMTIVGQCLGAGRKDEAVYYIKKLCVIAEIVVLTSCLIVFALTKPVTILGGMEKESADMCFHMVMWITIMKPLVSDHGICSGVWAPCGRRCEIFHDHILLYDVGMQILPLCISDQSHGLRTDGSLDRNVCRLDCPQYYFYLEIPQSQMAAA